MGTLNHQTMHFADIALCVDMNMALGQTTIAIGDGGGAGRICLQKWMTSECHRESEAQLVWPYIYCGDASFTATVECCCCCRSIDEITVTTTAAFIYSYVGNDLISRREKEKAFEDERRAQMSSGRTLLSGINELPTKESKENET